MTYHISKPIRNEKPESAPAVKEKMICSEECELITVSQAIQGRLEVTSSHIYFWDTQHANNPGVTLSFPG